MEKLNNYLHVFKKLHDGWSNNPSTSLDLLFSHLKSDWTYHDHGAYGKLTIHSLPKNIHKIVGLQVYINGKTHYYEGENALLFKTILYQNTNDLIAFQAAYLKQVHLIQSIYGPPICSGSYTGHWSQEKIQYNYWKIHDALLVLQQRDIDQFDIEDEFIFILNFDFDTGVLPFEVLKMKI